MHELRVHFGGLLSQVLPTRLVSEDDRGRLLAITIGTPVWRPTLDRAQRDIPRDDWPSRWRLDEHRWFGHDVLIFQPSGMNHAVWWFFEPHATSGGSVFAGWYVNLETRSRDGHDVVDQELDIWVAPDRSWQWKDEQSFADKTGDPRFWTVDEAAQVRQAGRGVIKQIEVGEFPFDGTWCGAPPQLSTVE